MCRYSTLFSFWERLTRQWLITYFVQMFTFTKPPPHGMSSMELTTKKLRPYQVRLVTDVCRATEDVLVEQPTGSGKTVQIVTLVAMHLGQRFSHALISAPQEQIEQGFVKRDYQVIAFPDCQCVGVPSIQAPKSLIIG